MQGSISLILKIFPVNVVKIYKKSLSYQIGIQIKSVMHATITVVGVAPWYDALLAMDLTTLIFSLTYELQPTMMFNR
ncbi:MAG: hypothetical protein M3114_02710 [Thermoproteota archaeon]|nr:hypothetical protein [Thermoproteota archaeon]